MDITGILAKEFNIKEMYVVNTVKLLDEGNTVPFIARYRKEMTCSLDDQVIRELSERLIYLRKLSERKEEIADLINEQGKLTDEIKARLDKVTVLTELEDIYRPYRPKKKTRASIAKEKGLEPLADLILKQRTDTDPEKVAKTYISKEKGVQSIEECIQGAMDIIAENVASDAEVRKKLRVVIVKTGSISTEAVTKEENSPYAMYYDFTQPVRQMAGHRVLAIDRGESEGKLKVKLSVDEDRASDAVKSMYVSRIKSRCSDVVEQACEDSYKRLILPSLERELRNDLTAMADRSAIKLFAANLKQLLLQPPIKGMNVLGLDPGYRTGCKIAVVDYTGKVLDTGVIYPTPPKNDIKGSAKTVKEMIQKHNVSVIAIGNGTASRESESFIAEVIKETGRKGLGYVMVSEAGASVYSASKLAAAEFPEYDVSLRSAISIARRLQDPLAELVKIEPQAIGVGQYQHDMPKKELESALGGVVEDCVNYVGVDLNTASVPLLSRVAGINSTVAGNIVKYREERGCFTNRKQLMDIPKLGKNSFKQCAGFLRVSGGDCYLDTTAVHPESYSAAIGVLRECGLGECDLKAGSMKNLDKLIAVKGEKYIADKLSIGIPTLRDILSELQKPGRDPRDELPKPILQHDVLELEDLKEGMVLDGTVRNIVDFGAFIDIGVHQDGLVHLSEISKQYIKHPMEVLSVGDIVKVRVLGVDKGRKRISLSMLI